MASKNKLRPEKNKKVYFIACIVTVIVIFLVMMFYAYCLLSYAHDKRIKTENLYALDTLKGALEYMMSPKFFLPYISFADTFKIAFIKIWWVYALLPIFFFLGATSGSDRDYKGIEKGSARWASNSSYKKFQDHTGIVVGKNFYVTVDSPKPKEIGKNPMEMSEKKAGKYLKKKRSK